MKEIACFTCKDKLQKDHIALNKKLIGRNTQKFLCLVCLAEYIDCDVDDLIVKIEEFKELGCALFG